MTKLSKRTIAVTGYESFGSFDVNPSQVVVDNLAKKDFGDKVEVVCSSLPVAYRSAEECSSKLCKKNDFVIHLGVMPFEKKIHLEQQAKGEGYCCLDVLGDVPLKNRPKLEFIDDFPVLHSSLDCSEVIKHLVNLPEGLKVEVSDDPGRYLCSFIFYCSLANNDNKALFVHIPPFDDVCTVEVITDIVVQIIHLVAASL